MKAREFNQAIEIARCRLRSLAESGAVRGAKEADEAAAELVGESRLKTNSKQFDTLLATLYREAGKLFPGNWEDYLRRV